MNNRPRLQLTPVEHRAAPDQSPGFSSHSPASGTSVSPQDTEKEFDLFQLFAVLWQGKWIIILCAILVLLAGGYYAFRVAVPMYLSDARLALNVRDQNVVNLDSVISGVSTEVSAINTELEVIRSRTLVERLVSELNLVEDPEFNGRLTDVPRLSIPGTGTGTGTSTCASFRRG